VTSRLAVFEAAMQVKLTHLIKSYLKTAKKRKKSGNRRIFLHKSVSER